jgi:hypothetical protein
VNITNKSAEAAYFWVGPQIGYSDASLDTVEAAPANAGSPPEPA